MKKLFLFGVTLAVLSLALPTVTGGEAIFTPEIFSLKDGRVYRGETALDCVVHEVPDSIDGPIRYWSAFGHDTSDEVKENETGVWFFTGDGSFLTFITLDSEYEYQGLLLSPNGDRLVLVRGGMRADVFFDVYGEGMEKQAELSGFRGEIAWVDSARFVFTRIDDIREDMLAITRYAFKCSVIMYDAAEKKEIVLKEASDTQGFAFIATSEDGESVVISETSVESPKDWQDWENEEKIKEKEISVPIPAAG